MEEVVLSIVAQNIKVIIDAYILGTLFHYLVRKDPELEAARDLMAGLNLYCAERALPSELTKKMEAHVLFQQNRSSAISSSVLQVRCSDCICVMETQRSIVCVRWLSEL